MVLVQVFIVLVGGISSCNGFFDFPDSSSFNEDSVFSQYRNAERLVFEMYTNLPDVILSNGFGKPLNGPSLDVITDGAAAFSGQSQYGTHKFTSGGLTSSNVTGDGNGVEYAYNDHWKNIRIAHTLIERINEVPDATVEQKERIIGEAKTMLALKYFEMFKRFGGVPLVKKRLDDPSEYKIPRSSLKDTYDYIIQLCDEAIDNPYFPARTSSLEFGRLTKAAAYGIKAKTMLWAASPLFNTSSPYMSLGENNELICFGSEDKERWKLAADAARDAIDFCEANGYAVVDNQGNTREDYIENYKVATQYVPSSGNTEVIWGRVKPMNADMWFTRGEPMGGWATNVPTHNQVEKYRKNDGKFVDWSTRITTAVNNPDEPYEDLEPRFHATIAYNGKKWYDGVNMEFFRAAEGGVTDGRNSMSVAKTEYSYALHKYVWGFEDVRKTGATWRVVSTWMRLSELYFAEAEALNNYDGETFKTQILASLNKVLKRSGMSAPENLLPEDMARFIEREKAVEFFFESQRYFDLKRWLKGDELAGEIYDVDIRKYNDGHYTFEKVVRENRVWNNHYYLWPFPQAEINKNYGLIQNPGW